jgi:hypothetical protein
VTVPKALTAAWEQIADGVKHLGEGPAAARRRTLGVPYTAAIEGIRRALPTGFVYVLINADDHDEAGPLWTRFDLAPHPAIFLGRLSQLPPRVRRAFPRGPQPVVLVFGDSEPPRLIARHDFLDWFETPGRTGPPPGPEAGSAARPR